MLAAQMILPTNRAFLMPLHALSNSCTNNFNAFSLMFCVWENKKALNSSIDLQGVEYQVLPLRSSMLPFIGYLQFKRLLVLSAFSNRMTKSVVVFT